MGQSLVVHLARSWRPRFVESGERLRITVLDRDARRRAESLLLRYPQLGKVCELEPLSVDIRSPEFERAEFLFGPDGACDVTAAYVSVDDDSFALYTALSLRQHVRGTELPIIVRMSQASGLAALLGERTEGRGSFPGVHAFGLLDETCTPELVLGGTHESLARAIHEDYVRRETERGETPTTNPSMAAWERLPAHLRESNRLQADHAGAKLAAIGYGIAPLTDWDAESFQFAPADVETMAEMEYVRFTEERRALACGRRSRGIGPGEELGAAPWSSVAEEEKEKNRDIVRRLPALLALAGFQVYRLPATRKTGDHAR